MIDKLVRDGKVAILYSPGWGAGWYTWNREFEQCIYDPDIVKIVLGESDGNIGSVVEAKYGEWFYDGGAGDLVVAWLPEGTKFVIEDYDGNENLTIEGNTKFMSA